MKARHIPKARKLDADSGNDMTNSSRGRTRPVRTVIGVMKQKRQTSSKSPSAAGKPRRLVAVRVEDPVLPAPEDMPQPVLLDAVAEDVFLAVSDAVAPVVPAEQTSAVLALAENCILRDANALKEQLLKLKDMAEPVTLEVGAVQRIETANLQVLGAFVRDRVKAGRRVHWSGESPALSQAIRLLGLNALLEFDVGSAS